MQVILTVVAGPHLGQSYSFDRHEHFLVGRAKVAHFRLPAKDPFFSRLHFMVEVNPPACRLIDMKSTNGTSVNGRRVEAADLTHGDIIEGGDTRIQVTISEETSGDTAATAVKDVELPLTFVPAPSPPTKDAEVFPVSRGVPTGISPDFAPPGYLLEAVIGVGGMGVVYRARRVHDGTAVAIKAVKPAVAGNAAECCRFLREIEILRQLDHPGIVRLLDAGEIGSTLYFVMELVHGIDVDKWVNRQPNPVLPIRAAIRLMLPILEALEYAHDCGFVHRDVKPGNVLLSRDGKRLRPQLTDFGLARAYQESKLSGLTLTGDLYGTPKFMAPEQITDARRVKPSCDQYSAAAMLYRLITGQYTHDFSGNMQTNLQKILLEAPVSLPERRGDVPGPLAETIDRALKKDPARRWKTIRDFRLSLLPFAERRN